MEIKNKRYVLICAILHAIILVFFCRMANSAGKILYNTGLLRDELSITGSEPIIIGDGLWATFMISCIFCILSFAMLWWTIRSVKKLVVFCAFALIFLFFGKYVVDVSSNYYHNIESHKSSINRIDLKRLEELSSFTDDAYLYIGRDDCKACIDTYNELEKIVSNYKVDVLYYNTLQDRETNYEDMQKSCIDLT